MTGIGKGVNPFVDSTPKGMTIQQAMQEGKYFKRPHHTEWQTIGKDGILIWAERPQADLIFTAESILATDWQATNALPPPVPTEPRNVVQLKSRHSFP